MSPVKNFSMFDFIKSNSSNTNHTKKEIELIIQEVLKCDKIDLYTNKALIPNKKQLQIILHYIEQINSQYTPLKSLSDKELKSKFSNIKSDFLELIKDNKKKFYEQGLNTEDVDNNLYELEKKIIEILLFSCWFSSVSCCICVLIISSLSYILMRTSSSASTFVGRIKQKNK